MFVDEVDIQVRAGNGGHGCLSFRREKFIPKGGPDGGNGGNGGSVFIEATDSLSTLSEQMGHHRYKAGNGLPGQGQNKTGRSGQDAVIRVPTGTIVYDRDKAVQLKDLNEDGMRICVARGGKGGHGNATFATSTNQAPRKIEEGEHGEERWLHLELKLIADVGIVGLPNAGKSTLLAHTSRARPKIADYPFTTLEPQLGIVELSGYRRLVLADIPGLIEGAHQGLGLGHAFLRHIERTRVLLHLIDVMPMDGSPSPHDAYRLIRAELERYSSRLADKPELVVANKMDLSDSQAAIDHLRAELGCEVLGISAVAGTGLQPTLERLWQMVEAVRQQERESLAAERAAAEFPPEDIHHA
jgi:GTPase